MTLELGQTSENWRFSFHYDSVGLCCGFVVLLINYLPIAHNTWKIKNTSVAQQIAATKTEKCIGGVCGTGEIIWNDSCDLVKHCSVPRVGWWFELFELEWRQDTTFSYVSKHHSSFLPHHCLLLSLQCISNELNSDWQRLKIKYKLKYWTGK